MSRETPQAAFEHTQAAMLRGDLFEVFACLDVNDLKRVAANAVALSLGTRIDDADEEVRRICDEHRFPLDDLLSARRRVMQMPGMEATTNQRDTMNRGLAAVSNLPAFLAALEGYSRRVSGDGSINVRLFQNETLSDVQVVGSRARGSRVDGSGSSDDVEFVQRKGQWYLKLIARQRCNSRLVTGRKESREI
jgi:hypothetical protein